MAEKLSIQIALDGGKEIERQLADIGEAGRKAFVEIAQAADKLGGFDKIKPEVITQKLKDLGVTGKETFEKIHAAVQQAGRLESVVKGIQSAENAFASLTSGVVALGRALGPIALVVGAIGSAVTAAAASTVKFAESINKATAQAQKLGLTFEQFDKLRKVLQAQGLSAEEAAAGIAHLSGVLDKVNVERVTKAIEMLAGTGPSDFATWAAALKTVQEAAKGTGATADRAREAMAKLAIMPAPTGPAEAIRALVAASGDIEAKMPRIVELLRQIPDETQRAAVAFQYLGDNAGPALLRAGKPAGDLTNAINRARTALDALNSLTFAPLLIQGIDMTTAAINALNQWLQTISWDAFAKGAMTAINRIIGGFGMMGTEIAALVTTPVAGAWQWISDTFNSVVDGIVAKAQAIRDKIKNIFSSSVSGGSLTDTGGGGGGFAHGGRVGGRGSGTSDSNLAWVSRGEHIMPARVVRQPGVLAFLEALRRGGGIPGYAEGGSVGGGSGLFDGFIEMLNGIYITIDRINRSHTDSLMRIMQDLRWAGNALDSDMVNLQDSIERVISSLRSARFARGGMIGGRGTGTSDSNLAWLSRGEYVTPARAVRQPGVLAFLEALRRSGGNLRRVLDGMGRFALGGMVPRTLPAFAAGGLNGMSNVTIQFPGLPAIGGLRASSDVVDDLRKAAALAQVRSGGRKPSRYS